MTLQVLPHTAATVPNFGRQVSTQSFAALSGFHSALFHVLLGISRQFLLNVPMARTEPGGVWYPVYSTEDVGGSYWLPCWDVPQRWQVLNGVVEGLA